MFNSPEPIIEHDQMKNFCADWASTVDGLELTPDVQKVALTALLGMINSPHWCPHIVTEKLKLLEYFTLVPEDSQPLRRCINNPDLIDVIKYMDNQAASFLWLEILWLKYGELIPQVRVKLEEFTKEIGQGRRRTDLGKYPPKLDSELGEVERALMQYNTWSADPAAVTLRTKIENLQEARSTLGNIKDG